MTDGIEGVKTRDDMQNFKGYFRGMMMPGGLQEVRLDPSYPTYSENVCRSIQRFFALVGNVYL